MFRTNLKETGVEHPLIRAFHIFSVVELEFSHVCLYFALNVGLVPDHGRSLPCGCHSSLETQSVPHIHSLACMGLGLQFML